MQPRGACALLYATGAGVLSVGVRQSGCHAFAFQHVLSVTSPAVIVVLPQVGFKPPLSAREAAFLHELQTERFV